MAARPLWSGSISFGLVSIPVRMFAATQSQELRFHFVDRRDLTPVGYDKVRKDTGEHVDPDEIVRAFDLSAEFDPGKYDDTYRKELLELIRSKAEGVRLPEPQREEGEVVDLMQALRESVERTKRSRAPRPRAKKAS
jgi:non-homologous end joining protein Ku